MAGDTITSKHRKLDNLDNIFSQRLCERMRAESPAVPATCPEGSIRFVVLELSTHEAGNEDLEEKPLNGDGSKDSNNCMGCRPCFKEPEELETGDVANNAQGMRNRSGDCAELFEAISVCHQYNTIILYLMLTLVHEFNIGPANKATKNTTIRTMAFQTIGPRETIASRRRELTGLAASDFVKVYANRRMTAWSRGPESSEMRIVFHPARGTSTESFSDGTPSFFFLKPVMRVRLRRQ